MANPTGDEMLDTLAGQQPIRPQQQSTSESVSVQTPIPMDPQREAQARANVGARQKDLEAVNPQAAVAQGETKLRQAGQQAEQRMAPINEQAQKLDKLAQAVDTDIDVATKQYQQQQTAYDEGMAQQQLQIQHLDKLSKDIAANSTPRDFWADKSTGYKIGAAIFAGLGAFAGTQQPVEIINNAIQRDLMLQRLKLQNDKDNYATQNSLLGQMRAVYKDKRDADKAAYLAALQGAKGKLDIIAKQTNDAKLQKGIAATLSQLDVQIAGHSADLVSKGTGQLLDQKKALADSQDKLERLGAAQNGVGLVRAQTAAKNAAIREDENQRKQAAEGRAENAVKITDWDGEFQGTAKDSEAFRIIDADTTTAVRAMDKVRTLVGKGVKNLSWSRWQDISANANRAILWLKGKGIANAGANFTEMEKDLVGKAYLGADGTKYIALDPTVADRILAAEQDLFQRVKDYGHKHGITPSKTHEFLGE